jgi:AcrR family transcriptional regulator
MAEPPARSRDAAATRDQLAHAARPLFAAHGYEATTVSQIARAAGFSPNLITRYFGGKEGLFLAATKAKLDLDAVLVGGIGGFGQRLADQMVDGWEQGDGDPLLALLRSSRPAALVALGEFLEDQATAPLTRALTAWGCTETEASGRANAIQSVLLGTLVTRRMLQTGAVAAATGDGLREWLADVLQRLVEGGSPRGLDPRRGGTRTA